MPQLLLLLLHPEPVEQTCELNGHRRGAIRYGAGVKDWPTDMWQRYPYLEHCRRHHWVVQVSSDQGAVGLLKCNADAQISKTQMTSDRGRKL